MKQSPEKAPAESLSARERFWEMAHLQAIEGNPLTPEDLAIFEMFEREGWSDEQCLAYLLEQARKAAVPHAAE